LNLKPKTLALSPFDLSTNIKGTFLNENIK
jgi:hypothetical protein